jgi:hypothetical protein
MQDLHEEKEIMAKGIELKKLKEVISKADKVDSLEDYVIDRSRGEPLIPLPLKLHENPENGKRRVMKTHKYLDVIFTERNGKAYDIAIVGRYNISPHKNPLAKRIARGQCVRYSNGKFFKNYSGSLKEIRDNLERIVKTEKIFDQDDMMLYEQQITTGY